MATTNWDVAIDLDTQYPYTFASMQALILAIEDAATHQGQVTWYGKDMGLITERDYRHKLAVVLVALRQDGLVTSQANPDEYLAALLMFLRLWFQVFPNWPDVEAFVYRHLETDQPSALNTIIELLQISGDN